MQETATKPNEYELTPGESAVLQQINLIALNVKGEILDLQNLLEQKRAALAQTQQQFGGAVLLLAQSHGMSTATVTPDFARLVAQ